MGLVGIPVLGKFQNLAGAAGEYLLGLRLGEQLSGILHHLVQQQKPLALHLVAEVHQAAIHLRRGDAGEMGVEQVAHLAQMLRLHLQLQVHKLALDPAV